MHLPFYTRARHVAGWPSCKYTHTCISQHTYRAVYTHTHLYKSVCIYMYTHTFKYMYMNICIHTRTRARNPLPDDWAVHTHTHLYKSVYIYIYTHTYTCKYANICTGWRRLIGSPKLEIIFHKRATKYRSLLQKMTYKDKGSYESSPPCIHTELCVHIHVYKSACMYIYIHICIYYIHTWIKTYTFTTIYMHE